MNWTVELDHQISRRLYVHIIRGPEGQIAAQHMKTQDVLDWLEENEIFEAMFHTGTRAWFVTIEPRPW